MITTYEAASGIDVVTSTFPVPGFGVVPINAFVLHGPGLVLVDTGPIVEREEFMSVLRSVIDPADLRWIWLTHTDSTTSAPCRSCWPTTHGPGSSPPSSAWAS